METNPFLGVAMYVLAGLGGACFYLPFKRVKQWSWESSWLIYAVAGLLLSPWILALVVSPNVLSVLCHVSGRTLLLCYLFGAMWGVGGLTWGLMIRYLGVGLGLAVGCGVSASVGTLVPPLFRGELPALIGQDGGIATLLGVGIGVLGIILTGAAGMSKERDLSGRQKTAAVAEFRFTRGLLLGILSGILSAGIAFGLAAGKDEVGRLALHTPPSTPEMWRSISVWVVVLSGGFTVNFLWCLGLNVKNRSGGDYCKAGAPVLANLLWSATAGVIWYSQMALLSVGGAKSGNFAFAGWTVFMSSMVVFGTLLGIFMREWQGVSLRTKSLLAAALLVLAASLSTILYGSYLKPEITAGAIAKVDAAAIVVRADDDTEKTVPLDAQSIILLKGRRAAAGDLKVGQAVEVVKSRTAPLTIRASSQPAKAKPSP